MRPRIQSLIQSGCSNISFNMKCGYPPFSSCPRFISTVRTSGFWSTLSRLTTSNVLSLRITAISPSCRYTTLSVYSTIGVASEARKNSSFPIPTTSGLLLRAAIISSGLFLSSTAIAYAPITSCRANWTAVSKSKWLESWKNSINCTRTSVSVLLLKMNPFFCSFSFRVA